MKKSTSAAERAIDAAICASVAGLLFLLVIAWQLSPRHMPRL